MEKQEFKIATVIGGIGNKCNKDTQYHLQNRIYKGDIAITVCTCCNPYYAFEDGKDNKNKKCD